MAWEGPQTKLVGVKAGADLSTTGQYLFVKVDSNGDVVLCAGTTDTPAGVLQNKPKSGEAAEVCSVGVTKLIGGADLAKGAIIATTAAGKAQAAVSTQREAGIVLDDNSADGGILTAFVNCPGPVKA
jgi:hypothetical protein